jgi:hypothetical protein
VQFQLFPIANQLLKRLDVAVPHGLSPSMSVPPPFSPTARVPEEKGGLEAKRLSLDLWNPPTPRDARTDRHVKEPCRSVAAMRDASGPC